MPRQVNPDERRRQIARAVYRVVERGGLESASMREIAREAGCTTGALTHHFADRRALLDHAVGLAVDESMARLVGTARTHGLRAALAEFLPLDELRRQENAVWLVGVSAATRDPQLAASLSRRYAAANALLAEELRGRLPGTGRAGDPPDEAEVELLVEEVLSAVDGIAVWATADPERYPPERQLALVDRVLARTGARMSAEASLLRALETNAASERALLDQHARFVAASEDSNADDEHDPEGSTIAFERQQVAALLAQVRATGKQLRRSLEAVRDGRYGTCEACGDAIDPGRLEARPQARTCIRCARRASR